MSQESGRGTSAPLADRGADLYETPPCATRALLMQCRYNSGALPPPDGFLNPIWEPAAGRRAIADELIADGYAVVATDLVARGAPGVVPRLDFLLETSAPKNCRRIITNPPFKLADEFARHALELVDDVFLLLRLAYLQGAERSDLIDGGKLAAVYPFVERLPMMHRDGYEGKKLKDGGIPFAWFYWSNYHTGAAAVVRRISWRETEETLPEHLARRRDEENATPSDPDRCENTVEMF